MTDTNDNPAQAPLTGAENFRATATAFSQLTGVLGGFSITILVLVLDSSLLGAHKTARDWTVGLLLLAAVAYISSSGLLANSMNVDTFMELAKRRGRPQSDVSSIQQGGFSAGIAFFLIGNILLAAAIFITIYQASPLVGLIGLIGSIVIVFVAVIAATINIIAPLGHRDVHDDTTTKDDLDGTTPKDPGLT
jgi:hypothetical protein